MLAVAARESGEAFLSLYDRYVHHVGRYVLSRVNSVEAAEDVTSAVFLQALSGIHTFDPDRGTFAAWLFGIARRAVAAHFRTWSGIDLGDVPDVVDTLAVDPHEGAVRGERCAAMSAALLTLTAAQREALALHYLADLPFSDVGLMMGRSEAAAKMLVQRALENLRRTLRVQEIL